MAALDTEVLPKGTQLQFSMARTPGIGKLLVKDFLGRLVKASEASHFTTKCRNIDKEIAFYRRGTIQWRISLK